MLEIAEDGIYLNSNGQKVLDIFNDGNNTYTFKGNRIVKTSSEVRVDDTTYSISNGPIYLMVDGKIVQIHRLRTWIVDNIAI